MPLRELQLELIEAGCLVDEINAALARVCADVVARPQRTGDREVTVKITVAPKMDPKINPATGRADNWPEIDWSVGFKLPGNKGMTSRAFVHNGKVMINPGAPGEMNPNQMTIDDVRGNQ